MWRYAGEQRTVLAEETDDVDLAASCSCKQSGFAAVVVGDSVDVCAARKQERHLNNTVSQRKISLKTKQHKEYYDDAVSRRILSSSFILCNLW